MAMTAAVRLRAGGLPPWLSLLLLLPGCGLSSDESELTVTVVKGIDVAPPTMRQSEEPVARYFPDSNVVLVVSVPLYSSSCPPSGEAEMDAATLTLAVKHDSSEGDCTADANRYTFLVQGFDEKPSRLVIAEEERESVELDLGN